MVELKKSKINLTQKKKEIITPIITNSIQRYNDPYMPQQQQQSTPCLSHRRRRQSKLETTQIHHHHHHHYYIDSPILDQPIYTHSITSSPPPLSPTRPSWRSIRPTTWQPTPSISSSEEDNQPIGLSLLIDDTEEDGDDELIPIAFALNTPFMSAAEKYKAKVKAKLFSIP